MDREEIIEVLKNEVEKFVDFHDWDLAKRTVALYTGFHMVNEFENKFNQLESENKQLREECEWISVDDEVPEVFVDQYYGRRHSVPVLIYDQYNNPVIVKWDWHATGWVKANFSDGYRSVDYDYEGIKLYKKLQPPQESKQ